MDGAVVLVIVVAIAGVAISASKSKKKAGAPRYTSPLNDPNYRWKSDRGSSGNPDFTHSSNCVLVAPGEGAKVAAPGGATVPRADGRMVSAEQQWPT